MEKFLLAFIIVVSCNAYASQPLYTYAQSPIHSNILSLQLRDAKPQPVGSFELKTGYTQASIWAETGEYLFDYYQNNVDLALSYQVNPIWKSEIALKRVTAKDNGLDELTKNFHNLFGIGHNGRDEVPQDQFYLSIPNQNIEIGDFEGETLTRAIYSYNELSLYQSNPLSISVGASFYYNNVDSGPFARTSFEQGLQLNASYSANVHHLFSSFGLVHRNSDIPETVMSDTAGFISVGYEYNLLNNHSLLLESHNYKGWATSNPSFSEPSNEVLVGYRYRYMNSTVEAFMTENIRNMDNSTDIAFTIVFRILL
ncbi:DUF3187 family protein [Vibrio sp. VB16]|uniref:DUF3187 family protein n=1 Tax=Vibrio sp. VB16 TaxID=2785746 RepID=UPI001E414DD5|nr:DUF3187 family protein [Vibrio sp. VB16]UGA56142.1 DUF3187 family protein [Vibrio sp. VB16]